MPPPGELRARVELDTTDAPQQMQSMLNNIDQQRQEEFSKSEKMIRDLSEMSVDEYNKQINAQEKLLEDLRLKTEDNSRLERENIARSFSEREELHQTEMRQLDEKHAELERQHIVAKERLREIENIEIGGGGTEGTAAERLIVEQQIADVVSDSRENYLQQTQLAFNMEEDRIGTIKSLREQIVSEEGGQGVASWMEVAVGLPRAIEATGNKMKSALGPLAKLLGGAGIAFGLGEVVSKLYKANEELRAIRANYADIAASMGDFIGGLNSGLATGQFLELESQFMKRFGGSIDPKMLASTAGALAPGGFSPNEMVGLTEQAVFKSQAIGSGTSSQDIAGLMVRLHRDFGVPVSKLGDTIASLADDAHKLRIPFQDLAKWTTTLQEQTRIYGYTIADNQKMAAAFSQELYEGTIQLQDLINVQTSLARADTGQAVGMVAFLDQIGSEMGGDFASQIQGAGSTLDQATLLRAIGQGQMSKGALANMTPEEEGTYGQFFDTSTGKVKDPNLAKEIERAALGVAKNLAAQAGLGALGTDELAQKFMEAMGLATSKDFATRDIINEAYLTGGGRGGAAGGGAGGGAKDGKTTSEQLDYMGAQMLDLNTNFMDRVSGGMKDFWRESSSSIGLLMGRAFGNSWEDVQAQMRTKAGGAAISAFQAGGNLDLQDGKVISELQIREGIRSVMMTGIGSEAQQRSTVKDILQYMQEAGTFEGTSRDIKNLLNEEYDTSVMGLTSQAMAHTRDPMKPQGGGARFGSVPAYFSEDQQDMLLQAFKGADFSAGTLGDLDKKQAGVQLDVGGIQVTVLNDRGKMASDQDIKDMMAKDWQEILDQLVHAMQQANMGAGSR